MESNSSNFLVSSSEISTHYRCDNCGILLSQVSWSQCSICKSFDLCGNCAGACNKLRSEIVNKHNKLHVNIGASQPIITDCMKPISVDEAEKNGTDLRIKSNEKCLHNMFENNLIRDDYDMSLVMRHLTEIRNASSSTFKIEETKLNTMIVDYYMKAYNRQTRVLTLDGGGVRGYMAIKVLGELILKRYFPADEQLNRNDPIHIKQFEEAQRKFTDEFDVLAGTSTGGLIAFCLAINYNIWELEKIYTEFKTYFKRTWTGPFLSAKYNPSPIHKKIDSIINGLTLPNGTKLSAENATLLDIRNLLNPHNIIHPKDAHLYAPTHGNLLEFDDEKNFEENEEKYDKNSVHRIKKEKVLLITAYNTTKNIICVFNTSYAEHWRYRIADVLKATMAAPTYFPPQQVAMVTNYYGPFKPTDTPDLFIDGGVFANDPELATLWAIHMQWKKPSNYRLLSIGTGTYTTPLSPTTWGGYLAWIFKNGYVVNTLMDATRSLTEIIICNLAKFNNMKRMKFNYQIKKSMDLDDPQFVYEFNQAWKTLKNDKDFQALIYFYENFIQNNN